MRKVVISFLITLTLVVALAYAGWRSLQTYLDDPLKLSQAQVVMVEPGSSFSRLARQLATEGILERPDWFSFFVRLKKVGHLLKAGEYQLEPGTTPRTLLVQLIEGKTLSYNFSIIEGLNFKQLRASINSNPHIRKTLSDHSDAQIMATLGLEGQHPEGMFLADTYQFHRGMSDLDLLQRAHQLLQAELDKAWLSKAKDLPYESVYEALIMASIVEKETALASERPIIAGVFVQRLKKGMRLQTDPTVIYGMGERYQGNIRRADLRRPTAYNTYTISGLPPTPIAMVGREAITAALNPEEGKWLYFVAKGDGSHQFSATLKDHNKAVREYQLRRRSDYRSSPES
ncbi:endolytic transglycosylase MltG [Amphritea sp. 1_MG-2023]|uniref:endolytic transglycosylase MltG n=1 Tax=Amphritea sp. 1_MG-2023 TaxID=3062670 RepID=UPI0026E2B84D|nr:endolytic transglycosylase MltG [Amphritea sp. 1_MG-2023]MDO6563102.1 endolytic transglycosylase MltG [Amphritea sp. 1_MG-2023]